MPKRYLNNRVLRTENGRRYRTNTVYPDIPVSENDIYLITSAEDRYDTLAQIYYGDPSLWWIISTANSTSNRASLYPNPGVQIRIPSNKQEVLSLYDDLNSSR